MKIIGFFDYIFILRPILHLPVWTVVILGFFRARPDLTDRLIMPLSLLLCLGLFGAVFVINQIFDIESDRLNKKLHFLPRGIIKPGSAWIITIFLNLFSLIIAFHLGFLIGLVSLAVVILGILYSVPPVALKNNAWQAAIANGLGHGTLVFLLGYYIAGGTFISGILNSIPYFLAVTAVYIGTTLPDIDGDRKTGKFTLGVVLGSQKSKYIIIVFYLSGIISGYVLNDVPFLIAALSVFPFYIWSVFSDGIKITVLSIKLSVIILTLAAGYFYPVYIVFLAVLIYFTRIYYRLRFNMVYPSIK